MAWLSGWTDRAKLTIKGGGGITSDITDFPLTIKLTNSSGKLGTDMNRMFEKLLYENALLNDDFTGADYSKPNSNNWTYGEPTHGTVNILNNKLNLAVTSAASAEYTYIRSKYNLSGDFDIEASFDSLLVNSVNGCGFELKLTEKDGNQSNHRLLIKAGYNSGNSFVAYIRISASDTSATASRINNYGKLRLKRMGSVVTTYYKDGNAATWTQLSTRSGYTSTDCRLYLGNWSPTSGGAVSGNFDNFIINSGDVVWPPKTYPYRKKIAITSDDGVTMLPTEIHYWDVANKVIVLWTKVPTISAGTDTILYLYYDKTQIDNVNVGDVGETVAQSVWSGNSGKYQAVYHMSEYPTGSIKDSTNNLNDLSSAGSMTIYDLVNSNTLGYALDFDGSNDYLSLTSSKADVLMDRVDSANALSVSFWIEHRDTSNDRVFQYGVSGDPENEIFFHLDTNLGVFYEYGSGSNYSVSSANISNPTELHHMYVTIDSNYTKIYLDGNLFFSTNAASSFWSNYTARDLIIGAGDSTPSDHYLNGKLFEYHIANAMHTADYVKLSYLAESDNLITYEQYLGYVSGYVYIENTVTSGVDVYLYSREDGNYIGQTTSSGDGYFIIPTTCTGSHFVVALDKEESPTYNDIIKGRIPPHLIT